MRKFNYLGPDDSDNPPDYLLGVKSPEPSYPTEIEEND